MSTTTTELPPARYNLAAETLAVSQRLRAEQAIIPSYFVVMCDFGRRGLEAVVDPEITERGVVSRLSSGEYASVAFIHHVHDGVAEDVTAELFAQISLQEAA